jgi:hypothetical protein
MEIVYLLVGSAIILTCFYFIVSPFFSATGGDATGVENWEGTVTLDSVYGAVNELEMDYLMKKIQEKDFLQLKEQYQLLAAELVKQESKPKANRKQDRKLEEAELELLRDLQKLRKRKGKL